jgi:uncharacterized iron-regulated membrane protein
MRMRNALLAMHRWVGLVLAGFLMLAGITGALLVWNHELDAALNPRLFQARAPSVDAQPLNPLRLREQVQRAFPQAWVHHVPMKHTPGESLGFYIEGASDPVTGEQRSLEVDQVFVHPYSGEILGARRWGDITQGLTNLMPFIYRLHYSLALGTVGTWTFGVIALLWTLDCFVGAWLTMPARRPAPASERRSWWSRWRPAWQVRWGTTPMKVHFDLHRAGGLWPWALLFILAWSSVSFNLHGSVYRPVMDGLFEMQTDLYQTPRRAAQVQSEPPMGWDQALATGRAHARTLAQQRGFVVQGEDILNYDAHKGLFRLRMRTDRDRNTEWGLTPLFFDARSGELIGIMLPTGEAAGDTVTHWLQTLHTGHVWGLPYRVLLTAMGVVVAGLSWTGLWIWLRRRQARHRQVFSQALPARTAGEPRA